jgi:carbon-monoxide dehydrogenase small subunit
MSRISVFVNGADVEVDVDGWESLLYVLREKMGLPGAKGACEQGECGSCSVILDGRLVCSCLVLAEDAANSELLTVEGIASAEGLHPIQQALLDHGGVQCGFCTPGFVVAAVALFEENPAPSGDEIREALAGNICRCTGYGSILRALEGLGG